MKKHRDILNELKNKASIIFETKKEEFKCFFAPGRINIIGEHIDYNGGNVLPCTIDLGIYAVASKRKDSKVRCYSEEFYTLGIIEFDIKKTIKKENIWSDYIKGIILEMLHDGNIFLNGFDIYIKGTLPVSSGLSSSAALELVVGSVLRDLFSLKYNNVELSLIGQRCEQNFIGVNCGIMDQFVIGNCDENKALLLNTESLDYKYIKCELDENVFVIVNTNYKRTLKDSKYNERREECEKGLSIIRKQMNIKQLCHLQILDLEKVEGYLDDKVLYKRIKHVITENARVKEAIIALETKNYSLLGKILNESHESLKNDYEVTGFYLDCLVECFLSESILGARMIGAGFGGCVLVLLNKNKMIEVIEKVEKEYMIKSGLKADFYIVELDSKVRKIL